MAKIEDLVTLEDLQSRGWMTVKEAAERGVPEYMIYRWAEDLAGQGLARKLDDMPPRGMWLISPEAFDFLQAREGLVGRPPEDEWREK